MNFHITVGLTAAGEALAGDQFELRDEAAIGVDRRRHVARHDHHAAAAARALAAAHRREANARLPRGFEQDPCPARHRPVCRSVQSQSRTCWLPCLSFSTMTTNESRIPVDLDPIKLLAVGVMRAWQTNWSN